MSKNRFSHQECPVARSLDQIGDWWALIVVREVMYGTHQFNAMQASLGISRAVLALRLKELTENGILIRQADPEDGRAARYDLTEKGHDLWPVIVALLSWSNKHVLDEAEDIVFPLNPDSNKPIDGLCARDADGNVIGLEDMVLRVGKTASPRISARLLKAFPE